MSRKHVGQLECETAMDVIHKQVTVTVVEINHRYAVMAKVSNKTVFLLSQAIIKESTLFEGRVKTLNYDNGKEFCGQEFVDASLKCKGCFASWERGSTENLNGLLRQYLLKKRPMKNINNEEIQMI